ncbi:MAG: adenylyl-sulfate kinase [Bacteroidota bacterium]|nr:adenylyl-sulfate kinase [Bacteroidota bacterium]
MADAIFPFDSKITYEQRKKAMMQEPRLVWLTGLSGAGKTTLALRLEHYFFSKGFRIFMLDGDNVRNGLCSDLGFTENDRKENLRRVAEASKLMLDAGLIVISAFISPNADDRMAIKKIVGEERFVEVYVNCSVEVCEKRDVKGLYAKARKGIIPNFTGVSAPYDAPLSPDIELRTAEETVEESVARVIKLVETLSAYKDPVHT